MMAVLAFVFGHVLPLKIPNYPAFLVVGLLPWAWFQSATIAATGSVVGGRDLVRQPGFPVPMLPVVSIASTWINYVLALPVMFLFVGTSYGRIPPTVLALPIIMAVQFLLTLGPCYVLSALNVRFRDVGHIVEIALLPLFYATPVFYVQPPGRFHLVFALNPLAHLMGAYHDVFDSSVCDVSGCRLIKGRWPNFSALGVLVVVAVVLIVVGYRIFERLSIRFPEEL
jgi:lipopolysaccharide transport system permease protein